MRYVLTWVSLVVAVAIGFGSLNWWSYRRLADRGALTQATIIELMPKVHNTLRYEYHVAGRAFQGQMQSWPPNPTWDKLGIGQSVIIFYDPEHPETSVFGDPKPMLRNESISVALAAILFPTFLMAVWAWRTSRNHAEHSLNKRTA